MCPSSCIHTHNTGDCLNLYLARFKRYFSETGTRPVGPTWMLSRISTLSPRPPLAVSRAAEFTKRSKLAIVPHVRASLHAFTGMSYDHH